MAEFLRPSAADSDKLQAVILSLRGADASLKKAINLYTIALVGAGYAATLFQLSDTPVRVEAPDLVKGGVDFNFYGAAGVHVSDALAFQNVTVYTP